MAVIALPIFVGIKIAFNCMHEDSIVITPQGPVRVDQVKPGDKVLTQTVGGTEKYVTVLKNDQHVGDWEFISFVFADASSTTITSNHVMAVQRSFGPGISLAADVEVGQQMYIKDKNDLRPMEVVARRILRHPRKFYLVTESGTLLLDGVLTTTICDNGVETLPLGLEAAQKVYLEAHDKVFEEYRRDLIPATTEVKKAPQGLGIDTDSVKNEKSRSGRKLAMSVRSRSLLAAANPCSNKDETRRNRAAFKF